MSIEEKEIDEAVREFILGKLVTDPEITELASDEDLLESSLVDSLGIMHLIGFIESRFQFAVPGEDVTVENFESVSRIACYLQPRLNSHED